MLLRDIHIENFRAYKEFDCRFDKGVNLVIGDNGAGKTSLLAAIAQLLSLQVSGFGGSLRVETGDPYQEVKRSGDATISVRECFPISISGTMETDEDEKKLFSIVRKDYNNSEYKGNSSLITSLTEKEGTIWPLISFQRFDREWKLGKNTGKTITMETGLNQRADGYKECLSGNGQDTKIQSWCLKMSMLEFERKASISEFTTFKSIIQTFLRTIEDIDGEFEVSYSVEFSGLALKMSDDIIPLYELSTGYKALLSMIMELAYRTVLLNPGVQDVADRQTGIVVIDEVDTHLHPKWQWRVMDALTACFPNVQFIIATHSPIVISSAKEALLISLGKDQGVTFLDGAYGYNVEDVLNLRQGSEAIPKLSGQFMERLEAALDEHDYDQARAILDDAKHEFGEESPVYTELENYLEINSWVENN